MLGGRLRERQDESGICCGVRMTLVAIDTRGHCTIYIIYRLHDRLILSL
jgi:hypothetical protein